MTFIKDVIKIQIFLSPYVYAFASEKMTQLGAWSVWANMRKSCIYLGLLRVCRIWSVGDLEKGFSHLGKE